MERYWFCADSRDLIWCFFVAGLEPAALTRSDLWPERGSAFDGREVGRERGGLTAFHEETLIHGIFATKDFLKDGMIDDSHIDVKIKEWYGSYYKEHWEHAQLQADDVTEQLFIKKALRGMKSANSMWSSGKHYNNAQLEEMLWQFSGSRKLKNE